MPEQPPQSHPAVLIQGASVDPINDMEWQIGFNTVYCLLSYIISVRYMSK